MSVAIMAFPLYILLMLLELAYERFSGRHTYRLADAATSINTGASLNQRYQTWLCVF